MKLEPGALKVSWKNAHGRRRAKNTFSLKWQSEIPVNSGKEMLQVLWLHRALGLSSYWKKHAPSRDCLLPTLENDKVWWTAPRSGTQQTRGPDCGALTPWPPESFLTSLGSSFLTCKMPVEDLGQTLRVPPALTFCDSRCSYMSPGNKAHPRSLLEKKERKREKKNTSINVFIAQPVTVNHGIINSLLYSCLVPWLGAVIPKPSSTATSLTDTAFSLSLHTE